MQFISSIMKTKKQINNWFLGSLIVACCVALVLAYNQSQNKSHASMNPNDIPLDNTTKEALQTVINSRVLFTHQSLGDNIMEGLEEIINEAGLGSEGLLEAGEKPFPEGPALVHLKLGKNGFPETKIDGFADVIRELDSFAPQVAAMKFCFVDFDPYTDVDQVLDSYKNNIETLKTERPEILFAHVTVPLKIKRDNLKQRLNRFVGRMVWSDESNLKRAEFNRRLHEVFEDDPIFDLARIESTKQDGSREQHSYKGREYYSLVPEYTNDGAHLNALGKRVVAIEMARFLGEAIDSENASQ